MTIYDRARNALNKMCDDDVWTRERGLHDLGQDRIELAAEVVMLHDEFSALAGELEREAEEVSVNTRMGECRTARALALSSAATRIRKIIEENPRITTGTTK